MHIVLSKKFLQVLLFSSWVMFSLYTIYNFTYLQSRLRRNGFLAGCTLIHTFTRVCQLWKQSTMHKPTSHFAQKYSVLPLLFFIAHTRQWRFPFEDQCWGCFTSRRLIWDTDGLGLPRATPLEVTFCSWDFVIKLRTRTSLTFLCVILPPHVLWSRKA